MSRMQARSHSPAARSRPHSPRAQIRQVAHIRSSRGAARCLRPGIRWSPPPPAATSRHFGHCHGARRRDCHRAPARSDGCNRVSGAGHERHVGRGRERRCRSRPRVESNIDQQRGCGVLVRRRVGDRHDREHVAPRSRLDRRYHQAESRKLTRPSRRARTGSTTWSAAPRRRSARRSPRSSVGQVVCEPLLFCGAVHRDAGAAGAAGAVRCGRRGPPSEMVTSSPPFRQIEAVVPSPTTTRPAADGAAEADGAPASIGPVSTWSWLAPPITLTRSLSSMKCACHGEQH